MDYAPKPGQPQPQPQAQPVYSNSQPPAYPPAAGQPQNYAQVGGQQQITYVQAAVTPAVQGQPQNYAQAGGQQQITYVQPVGQGQPIMVQPSIQPIAYANAGGAAVIVQGQPMNTTTVPMNGAFKDGCCDCFNQMIPSCCMSFWCDCILLGQVQQKIGHGKCSHTVIAFTTLYIITYIVSQIRPDIGQILQYVYWISLSILTCQVRRFFIKKYAIQQGECLDGCGNCCGSFFCTCCLVSQMARHLHNYQQQCDECCVCNATGDLRSELQIAVQHV